MKTKISSIIGSLFVLIPLWWFIGVEQFVWLLVGSLLLFRRFRLKKSSLFYILFVVFQIFSLLSLEEPYRMITFFRTWLSYVVGLIFFIVATNYIRNKRDALVLIRSLSIFFAFSSFISILGIFGVWRPQFVSLIGRFLPEFITNTVYGSAIAIKTIGSTDFFYGLGYYFRVSSFWSFAGMYAFGIAIFVPVSIWCIIYDKKLRLWHTLTFLGVSFSLIFTTARVAIIAVLATSLIVLTIKSSWFLRIILGVVLLWVLLLTGLFAIDDIFGLFLYRSFNDRLDIYTETIKWILRNPLFGYATERDVSTVLYPLGSHSTYLGILFKYGIFGFTAWICYIFLVVKNLLQTKATFARFSLWSVCIASIICLSDAIDLDTLNLVVFSVVVGLGLSSETWDNRKQELREALVTT
ncbi:MAG: hypothetical protein KatS3mg087_2167 [Patescibacteria group bacterium]|uniref:O-antigen ligase family protein n=1 Tax=Chloroflexus sp. TaxID=1904827 RepID=UPI0021DBDEFC|nr:O-antigen ligase family protein [Chloroflexus sp.]GIV91222.1 MAG: hypothetical protein KatS3mg055_3740 [Chloroflexus sp.]GIW61101.1 MAG: hypothetical protein KatS3mg087_2167 [Patescibacteria group bacterium]